MARGGDWNIDWVAETQSLRVQLPSQAYHSYRRESYLYMIINRTVQCTPAHPPCQDRVRLHAVQRSSCWEGYLRNGDGRKTGKHSRDRVGLLRSASFWVRVWSDAGKGLCCPPTSALQDPPSPPAYSWAQMACPGAPLAYSWAQMACPGPTTQLSEFR